MGTLLRPSIGFKGNRRNPLSNPDHVANIYVRLLPPEARDVDLYLLGVRFGGVRSVRALLEQDTAFGASEDVYEDRGNPIPKSRSFLPPGAAAKCRGVGFVLFGSIEDATKAVVGLNEMGFDASFAKESIGLKLRDLADAQSANLYLSNLPNSMTENDLEDLFSPMLVKSVRLLREPQNRDGTTGDSRGIGFARLSDRQSADAAIVRLQDVWLQGSRLPLKIRYADSPGQKDFKARMGRTSPRELLNGRRQAERSYGILTPPLSPKKAQSSSSHGSGTSGSSHRRPASSRTSFGTPPSFPKYAPASCYTPSSSSFLFPLAPAHAYPASIFPPTPPHSPIHLRALSDYLTLPPTPSVSIKRIRSAPSSVSSSGSSTSSSSRRRRSQYAVAPPSSSRPYSTSAGPLRTRFHILPYETVLEEEEDAESIVEEVELTTEIKARMIERRRSLS